MLVTSEISHRYSQGQSFSFPDINCNHAQTLLVLGQSGVGKTTLLHILAGILRPNKGSVSIDGHALYSGSSADMDTFRGRYIGLIFQKPHFVQSLTALENIELAARLAGQQPDKRNIKSLLSQLNISEQAHSRTYRMSQGEQQRLSIARALINSPKLILADEPTSALDDKNCHEVVQLLQQQAAAVGAALVIVTHDNRLKDIFTDHVTLN